jgi:outer membrane usher protein
LAQITPQRQAQSATISNEVASPAPAMTTESLVAIILNRTQVIDAVPVLQVPRLGPVMHITEFEKLGLVDPKIRIAIRGDEDYVPLNRVKGLEVEFDARKLELKIQADVVLLKRNVLAVGRTIDPAEPKAGWGAFLNYDLLAYRGSQDRTVGGNFETVFYTPKGSLVSNYSALRGQSDVSGNLDRNVRLETYYQYDVPDRLWRFRLGDSFTTTGSWGRAVRFGGIKFGTEFSLNPNLVTLPLLQLNGSVSVPSSVDLFINNSLQRNFNVPAGPFTIDQIPTVTGAGNARIVVRNNLGQDQVIEVPFFRAPRQLSKGLAEYGVELGTVRRNFGLVSSDYSSMLASGTWRYGVTTNFTAELRGEALKGGERNLGAAAVFALPAGFLISPGVVSSHSLAGFGRSAFLSLGYSGDSFRVNARAEGADEHYRQVGFSANEIAFARRNVMTMGWRLSKTTDLGLTYIDNLSRTDGRQRIMSASLSARLLPGLYGSANVNRTISTSASNTVSFSLSWAGQDNTSAGLLGQSFRGNGAQNDLLLARYSQRPPNAGGYGYEVEAGTQQRARVRGELLGESGQVVAEAARVGEGLGNATRLTARGALIVADGTMKTSRTIDESFIIVKAPEVPGAQVSRGGGRLSTLDANGRAVIDRVQPYAVNPIAIVGNSLPLDANVTRLDNKVAVPAKAGRVLDLAVKRSRSVTLRLMSGGKPVPSGTLIDYEGQRSYVGNGGTVFILEIGPGGNGKVIEGSSPCTFKLVPPATKELLEDLGEIVCSAN